MKMKRTLSQRHGERRRLKGQWPFPLLCQQTTGRTVGGGHSACGKQAAALLCSNRLFLAAEVGCTHATPHYFIHHQSPCHAHPHTHHFGHAQKNQVFKLYFKKVGVRYARFTLFCPSWLESSKLEWSGADTRALSADLFNGRRCSGCVANACMMYCYCKCLP